ncbi:hypothetical protein PR048_005968 [Dryococelus australis]|uniref:Uncharacterized protein n=1 Tax=Dryococelus australis TaxID=614101 RepID=A0ABQ9IA94_9NEOP|nr:hypothetical protein PR048_005968 [Dryococelus australis]
MLAIPLSLLKEACIELTSWEYCRHSYYMPKTWYNHEQCKIQSLYPTRWIYTGNQINEIIEHYEEILATLENLKSQDKAAGLLQVFKAGSTFLVVMAKYVILKIALLNRLLQGIKQTNNFRTD